jgi:fatty-acyl-CoA synthase
VIDYSKTPAKEPLLESIESVEAFERTPLLSQFPHTNSYSLFQQSAKRFGDEPAIEFLLTGRRDETPESISFRQLADRITQTANLLHEIGVTTQDAVSILLPIMPQSHPAIWGAQAAGIANPINPMLEAEHIAEIIEAAESKVVICLGPSAHTDLWTKLMRIMHRLPKVHTILVVTQEHFTDNELIIPDNVKINITNFDTAIASQPSDQLLSKREFAADQVAAYFHTGGTTGHPKIAQLTHGNMAFLGQLMQVYTAHMHRHTVLCGLPLFHIYGVIIQGIAAFSVGYRVLLLTPAGFRSPEGMKNFWHHIDRFKVRGFSTVPTVLMALSQIPVGDADISSLTNINSGAAPLSPSFEKSFEKNYHVEVSNGYGMTETTALISRAPLWQPSGSVGMRIPYSQVRIAHFDEGRISKDCELGESGVILVKGPQVFLGYKAESDNAKAWVEDDWFNTGDLGYMDAKGYLYLSGRAKDLIIRGGHNIDPAIIEEGIATHPAVGSCIAVGLPDAYAGELPMAFVALKPSATCSADELLAYAEEHISERAAIPKRIEFIDAMPLTAVGKIFRPALRQRITEIILGELLAEQQIEASIQGRIDKKKGLVMNVKLADASKLEAVQSLLTPYSFCVEFV